MKFSEEVANQAWERAGGKCECTNPKHGHPGRCEKELVWKNRCQEMGWGCWEIQHNGRTPEKKDPKDCLVLCWKCYQKTKEESEGNNKI